MPVLNIMSIYSGIRKVDDFYVGILAFLILVDFSQRVLERLSRLFSCKSGKEGLATSLPSNIAWLNFPM
jgi:hypothetical protein